MGRPALSTVVIACLAFAGAIAIGIGTESFQVRDMDSSPTTTKLRHKTRNEAVARADILNREPRPG